MEEGRVVDLASRMYNKMSALTAFTAYWAAATKGTKSVEHSGPEICPLKTKIYLFRPEFWPLRL